MREVSQRKYGHRHRHRRQRGRHQQGRHQMLLSIQGADSRRFGKYKKRLHLDPLNVNGTLARNAMLMELEKLYWV